MERDGSSGVVRELRRLADATGRLVREHVDLARAELEQDARRIAGDAAMGVVALPFLLTAQLLLSAALALWIAEALGGPWAFAIVGGANLAAGAGLALLAAHRLRKDGKVELPATTEELERDRKMLRELRDGREPEVLVFRAGDGPTQRP